MTKKLFAKNSGLKHFPVKCARARKAGRAEMLLLKLSSRCTDSSKRHIRVEKFRLGLKHFSILVEEWFLVSVYQKVTVKIRLLWTV